MHQQMPLLALCGGGLDVGAEAQDLGHVLGGRRDPALDRLDEVVEVQRSAVVRSVALEGVELKPSRIEQPQHVGEFAPLLARQFLASQDGPTGTAGRSEELSVGKMGDIM